MRYYAVILLASAILLGFSANIYALPSKPFRFLNTENTAAGGGQIDGIDNGNTRLIGLADVSPSEFSAIAAWKGFASDGSYYYYLNTEGGAATFLGDIDRTNLAGTGRVNILDGPTQVQPQISSIGDYRGFAAHGDFFYFLNVDGSNPALGTIERMRMNGTELTTIADISPTPFGGLTTWQGFATDGQFFYLLNTDGSQTSGSPVPFRGRIERINFDGSGRTLLGTVEPDPFSNIFDWKGFAIASIPEPSSCGLALLGLFGLVGVGWRRRGRS